MANPQVSGGNTESSGAAIEKEIPNTESEKPQTVSRDAYEKAVTEAKKAREQLKAIEAERKQREEAESMQKQEFKKLYESAKSQADEWKGKYEGLNSNLVESSKLHAVRSKLSGNLPREYWGLVDTGAIAYDPETGEVEEASVAKYVKEFEKKHSRLIDKPTTAKLPNESAGGATKAIGFEAEIKAAKTQREFDAVMRKYGKID